jgi:hypothetical protein
MPVRACAASVAREVRSLFRAPLARSVAVGGPRTLEGSFDTDGAAGPRLRAAGDVPHRTSRPFGRRPKPRLEELAGGLDGRG